MTTTKQKREICTVVALLAVAAVVAYYRFLRHPAGTTSATSGGTPTEAYDQPELPAWVSERGTLAGPRPVYTPPARDLFAPTRPTPAPGPHAGGATPPRQSNGPILAGTVLGMGKPMAIIDGAVVAVGDSVSGYKVTAIDRRSVTLEMGTTQLKLEVPR